MVSKATFSTISLPKGQQVHTIANLLTEEECAAIISQRQNLVPANVTRNTIRDREQFDDKELSTLLWSRLKDFLDVDGLRNMKDDGGYQWVVEGLNERFRLCRYLPGGKFSPHFDGIRFASEEEQSFMSINIYMNTVPEANKGATRFLIPSPGHSLENDVSPDSILAKVQPVLGTAAIFRDNIWHDGEELLAGEKYLLRTDIMYRRVETFDFEELYGELGDKEKAWRLLKSAEKFEDSGLNDEAIKCYKKAFRLWPPYERGDMS